MTQITFPDVRKADENGLLCLGKDLDPETLVQAYRQGVFPWPFDDSGLIPWFAPDPRALLFIKNFHISRSLKRQLAADNFKLTINQATSRVIECCAESSYRKGPSGETWITSEMQGAYCQLSELGFCHSVECWQGDKLVGGLYGVSIGGMFAGESMFHVQTGASKLCLCHLVELMSKKGCKWIDCQQMSPLLG